MTYQFTKPSGDDWPIDVSFTQIAGNDISVVNCEPIVADQPFKVILRAPYELGQYFATFKLMHEHPFGDKVHLNLTVEEQPFQELEDKSLVSNDKKSFGCENDLSVIDKVDEPEIDLVVLKKMITGYIVDDGLSKESIFAILQVADIVKNVSNWQKLVEMILRELKPEWYMDAESRKAKAEVFMSKLDEKDKDSDVENSFEV